MDKEISIKSNNYGKILLIFYSLQVFNYHKY